MSNHKSSKEKKQTVSLQFFFSIIITIIIELMCGVWRVTRIETNKIDEFYLHFTRRQFHVRDVTQ